MKRLMMQLDQFLEKGFRTKDIYSENKILLSTNEMGDLVLEELKVMKKYNVAVVGATGNVGREILNILDDRKFPINKIYAVASSKSEGLKIIYGNGKELEVSHLINLNLKKLN